MTIDTFKKIFNGFEKLKELDKTGTMMFEINKLRDDSIAHFIAEETLLLKEVDNAQKRIDRLIEAL